VNDKNSEKFYKAFHDRFEIAQKEIKNLNSFMSTDINDATKIKSGNSNLQNLANENLDQVSSQEPSHFKNMSKEADDSYSAISNSNTPSANTSASNFGNVSSFNQSSLPEDIAIMKIILRFLQLLCENHNSDLQNLLRFQQSNKTSYNLVCDTLQFLDCICGSTTGGLGLLGLWINENNVDLVNQALETLTEYCQGPCHDNQYAIINHESNGIDIVIALILNDIQPLSKNNMEMFLAIKDNASKLLLAVMESNDDIANAERILYNITPKSLINVIAEAYEQGKEMDKLEQLQANEVKQNPPEEEINGQTNSKISFLLAFYIYKKIVIFSNL
jgi:hypothetical protein